MGVGWGGGCCGCGGQASCQAERQAAAAERAVMGALGSRPCGTLWHAHPGVGEWHAKARAQAVVHVQEANPARVRLGNSGIRVHCQRMHGLCVRAHPCTPFVCSIGKISRQSSGPINQAARPRLGLCTHCLLHSMHGLDCGHAHATHACIHTNACVQYPTCGSTVSSSSMHGSATSVPTALNLRPTQRTTPASPHCSAGTCTANAASARHSCVRTGGAPLRSKMVERTHICRPVAGCNPLACVTASVLTQRANNISKEAPSCPALHTWLDLTAKPHGRANSPGLAMHAGYEVITTPTVYIRPWPVTHLL